MGYRLGGDQRGDFVSGNKSFVSGRVVLKVVDQRIALSSKVLTENIQTELVAELARSHKISI